MSGTLIPQKTVLHIFTSFPEKYNSRFFEFALKQLPKFDHHMFAWNQQVDVSEKNVLLKKIRKLQNKFKMHCDLINRVKNADIAIFHGFFYNYWDCFVFLLWPQSLFSRILWVIWGGDLYYFKNRPKGLKSVLREWLRRFVLPKFQYVSTLVPGDGELFREIYGFKGKIYRAFYPNPVTYDENVKNSKNYESNKPLVLVGNSADPTNNHEIVLKALREIYDGSFGVYVPIAYGDNTYAEKIHKLAIYYFGNDAHVQREFLSPEIYSQILEEVKVGVFFHNRQQALGNILALLAMGKKVYIRSDTTSYDFLKSERFTVYDSYDILKPQFTSKELLGFSPIPQQREKVLSLFSDERAEREWRYMLNDILSRTQLKKEPH